MIKAFLFDFDGVVANVDIQHVLRAARPHVEKFRLDPSRILREYFYGNKENMALDLGLTTVETVREAIRQELWRGSNEEWLAWWQSVEDSYRISDSMSGWLAELEQLYCLGLITDNHLGFREWLMRHPEIGRYFKVVICSAEVGVKKPAEALYRLATERLGVTFDATLYLDDDATNTNAARILGIPSIHFHSVVQAKSQVNKLLCAPNSR